MTTALATNEEQLKDFITNFNRFFAVFAREQASLTEAIALLGPTLENARASLTSLNAALPDLEGFARDLTPGVEETPRHDHGVHAVDVAGDAACSPSRSPARCSATSSPRCRPSRHVVNDSFDLFEQTNLTSRCFNEVILPTGDTVLQDGTNTTGVAVFKEFWYTMVGVRERRAGLRRQRLLHAHRDRRRRHADPHRQAVRPPAEPRRPVRPRADPPQGTRPKRPSSKPPYNTDRDCYKNAHARTSTDPRRPPGRRTRWASEELAIQKNLREFIAVIVMVILAMFVGRLHPLQPALLPARLGARARHRLLRAEGGVLDRAVRHARPGADRADRGRVGGRDQEGQPQGRSRGRDAGGPAQVRRHDQAGRDHAPATEDRPQGHGHRDGPGHADAAGRRGGLHDPGLADRARRQPRRDPRQPRPRHARLPAPADRRRRRGPEEQRPQLRKHVPPVRAAQPRRRQAHRRAARSGARTSGA